MCRRHRSTVLGLYAAVFVLQACSSDVSTTTSIYGNKAVTISGPQAVALIAASASFTRDIQIPERFKDLWKYNFDITVDAQAAYVHFHPVPEVGETPNIGCCTRHGMEVSYEVDLRAERVISHAIGE